MPNRNLLDELEASNPFLKEVEGVDTRRRLTALLAAVHELTGLLPVPDPGPEADTAAESRRGLAYEPNFLYVELNQRKPFRLILRPAMRDDAAKLPQAMQAKPRGANPRVIVADDAGLDLALDLIRKATAREGIALPSSTPHPILERIVSTPGICGGRPRVRGTRVRVVDVLDLLASGMGEQEITRDYPYLTRQDIEASVTYARQFADLPVLGLSA